MSDRFDEGDRPSVCARTTDLGIYVLGGMDDAEARDLRLHVDTCPTCANELHRLRPIADLFGASELRSPFAGEGLEPAPEVAARLFAQAHAELADHPPASPMPAMGLRPLRRRTMVAATVVAFSLGAGTMVGGQKLVALRRKPPVTGERVAFQTVSLRTPSALTPPAAATPAKAWAWVDRTESGTYAWLYVKDFEVGKVYRWWFTTKDGTRVPLGSFRYPGSDSGKAWYQCPGHTAVDRADLVAIGATDDKGVDIVNQPLPKAPKIVPA